jgi:hypothetical protein
MRCSIGRRHLYLCRPAPLRAAFAAAWPVGELCTAIDFMMTRKFLRKGDSDDMRPTAELEFLGGNVKLKIRVSAVRK